MKRWQLLVSSVLFDSASGWITEATVELTKAPFDATTDRRMERPLRHRSLLSR